MKTKQSKAINRLDESYKKLRQSVFAFSRQTAKFKRIQGQYAEMKAKFEDEAGPYMTAQGLDVVAFEYDGYMDGYTGTITLRKSQQSVVVFDPGKIKATLKDINPALVQKAIDKQYVIYDMQALIPYLRSCGVDPAVFKGFVHVVESVNREALERMEELGQIDKDDLEGCYTVTTGKPYYRLTTKKDEGDE